MQTMARKKKDTTKDIFEIFKADIKIVKGMRSYQDDPVFLKKDEEMLEAIKKNPFPEHVAKLIEKD